MFSQPQEPTKTVSQKQKSTRKNRKKQKQKNKKKEINKTNYNFGHSVTTWAENFTMAATWQLKHQVAMWKARATALEYENQILKETLRNCYVYGGTSVNSMQNFTCASNVNRHNLDRYYTDLEPRGKQVNSDVESEESAQEEEEEEESELELEISEEYMAFLKQNFEYRKAREERKKKEAAEEQMNDRPEIMEPQPQEDRTEEFKELYGDEWKRIAALDSYLLSQFVSKCDKEKPGYWPNIPLRM